MSHFKGPDIERSFPNFRPNTSILKLLEEGLHRNGEAVAMVEVQTGKVASFKDILQQSSCIAAGLRSAGVTAGDYVVICGDKKILAYSILLGTMFTGATVVMFPVLFVDDMHRLTKGFPIKAVFCDSALLETVKKSITQMSVKPTLVATMNEHDEFTSSLLSMSSENFAIYEAKDVNKHISSILFSSGTTGEPKGIQLKDISIQLCATYFHYKYKTYLTASPLYWFSGTLFFVCSILYDYKLVLSTSTKISDNLEFIEKYKVDGWFVGTGSLNKFSHDPSLHSYDLSSLKQVFTGGEYAISSVTKSFVSNVFGDRMNLHNMYANTEGGFLTYAEIRPINGRFPTGFCGKVHPGVELKVVDDEGHVVPLKSMGEICAKSVAMTPGYWGRPDLTELAFDQEGFFRTGDAGFFDEDGNLYVRGRVGDLINFKGTKVSSAEVEDVLMSHEAVLEAAVVGKPHPVDNQHLTAFVVRVPGIQVSELQLENFVNGEVEDMMKLRGGVHFLDGLPRIVIGKVLRKQLREISKTLSP